MSTLRRSRWTPPVRQVHLGLGGFFRAHQAWYADRLGDDWGIAAFTGRSAELADVLRAQDGLYTLVTRGPDGDAHDVIRSVVEAHAAAEHEAWLGLLASPGVSLITTTVTEAGYRRGSDGGLDRTDPAVLADLAALRGDVRAPVVTAPARLVAGFAARRHADAGPISLIPCDNLPSNGLAVSRVVAELADLVDPTLAEWLGTSVTYVSSVVDRITPRTTPEDVRALAAAGVDDGRRSSPSRSASGSCRQISAAPDGRGRTSVSGLPKTSRPSSSASCGCSMAGTHCWPTSVRSAAPQRLPRLSTTTPRGPSSSSGGRRLPASSSCRTSRSRTIEPRW